MPFLNSLFRNVNASSMYEQLHVNEQIISFKGRQSEMVHAVQAQNNGAIMPLHSVTHLA
jgi:hypothetical protein